MQRVPSEAIAPFRPRVAKPTIDYLVRCVVRYAMEHYGERVEELPYEDLFLCMKSGVFRARQYGFEDFESITPFFISIAPETSFLERWVTYWGKNAGFMFTFSAEPLTVFRQLRKVFIVQEESGQEHFFRFYDPTVMRTYLATFMDEEKVVFLDL